MSTHVLRGAAAGVSLAAALAFAAPAMASYSATVDGTTLRVAGDGASDRVALIADPANVTVDVGEDGTADFTFPRSAFTAVSVTAGGGDDEVRLQGQPLDGVTVDGGAGNDTLLGGPGAETLLGGTGNDLIDGNIGADTVSAGSGNDTVQWDPGDGSDAVSGDAGTDALSFNGSNIGEQLSLTANGAHARFTRDIASIDMDLAAIEQVNVRTLGGADTLTVGDLAGTGVRGVAVDASSFSGDGDGAADRVVVNGTDGPDRAVLGTNGTTGTVDGLSVPVRATGLEPADTVTAALLGGDDTASASAAPTGADQIGVDGGAGTDTATYNGTAGDDQIGIGRNGATTVAAFAPGGPTMNVDAVESLVVKGNDGNDTLAGQNGIGTLTSLTLDGGTGDDTVRGGDGADALTGGPGNDLVDGNIGADTVHGGSGNDHLQWDPGDGSDVLEGDGGTDTLDFNGSNVGEQITLLANGPRVSVFRNIANITLDADGVEAAAVRTLGGTDDVTIGDLTGTDLRTAAVDVSGFDGTGDNAVDHVTVQGTDGPDRATLGSDGATAVISGLKPVVRVSGLETQDSATAALLGGDDTIVSGAAPTGEARVDADGGPGTDTATYTGTGGDDQIGIARDGAATVRTFAPGAPLMGTTAVEELVVQGGDANDTLAAQNGIGTLTHLTEDGGDGEDVLRGGDGADLLLGGNGDDLVDGNIGADTARLGAGNDHFQWDPGDGSDVVDGQSGLDVQDFNGSNIGEDIAVSADANRHVRITRNIAAVSMDLANTEAFSLRTLGGADNVTINDLSGTPLKSATVDLSAFDGTGDNNADTVTLNGTAKADHVNLTREGDTAVEFGLPTETFITGSEQALDTVRLNTLAGDDDVFVAPEVFDLINPVVDLGADG
jgi:Ca2+-binding RTX toxin-like protein